VNSPSLGIKIAPFTVWEILKTHGIPPAPDRDHLSWASFLRSQAHAVLATDVVDTPTLTGARLFILALVEHASRRIRILGATAHPTAAWTTQRAKNLVMDLQDAHARVTYLIRDPDSSYTAAFDAVLADSGITTITTGIRVLQMNAIMERWIRTCRTELLDRTLILNPEYSPRSSLRACLDREKCSWPGKMRMSKPIYPEDQGALFRCASLAHGPRT
jgi:putative transposase